MLGTGQTRRPWGLAFISFAVGIASIWLAISPVIGTSNIAGHGYVLSTIGIAAVLLGLTALRRNRILPSVAVLAITSVGIGAGVIGTVAMVAVAATAHPFGATGLATGAMPVVGAPNGQAAIERTEVTLRDISFTGAGRVNSVVVGNGGAVRIQVGYSVRSTSSSPRVNVRLERRVVGADWAATGATASVRAGEGVSVQTPSYTTARATEVVQYRLVTATSISKPVSVVYENQRFYSGIAATIYAYAAAHCPTTAVHVAELGGREAGDYSPGTELIRVDSRVGVSVNLEPTSQRALALHECSHERQWLNYGGTDKGNQQMLAAAAALFTVGDNGAPTIEHAADCGAMALEPNGYLGYGGYCTPDELTAAARLLNGGLY